jgi:23S rRNA pseudouridine1911/1915/1917 synthase
MKKPVFLDSHIAQRFHEVKIGRLMYEDDSIIVFDKAAMVLTTPTPKKEPKTVVGTLERYLSKRHRRPVTLGVVQRLDRETSGVLVLAKTPHAYDSLRAQFTEKKPERNYIAIVAGVVGEDQGAYEDHVFVDKYFNQKIARDGRIGQLAKLHYEVLERKQDATVCLITLETGRKNQIRAQFAERKHPVLGDQRYHRQLAKHPLWPHKRLALHAQSLGFEHPKTGQNMLFTVRLPEEFSAFMRDKSGT